MKLRDCQLIVKSITESIVFCDFKIEREVADIPNIRLKVTETCF